MPIYSLEPRQTALYSDLVAIHRKQKRDLVPGSKREVGVYYSETPDFTDVPCRIDPKSEASKPTEAGRSNHDIVDTTDKIHVHIEQDLGDGDHIQLLTAGHPEYGTWFVVMGGPQSMVWRAKAKAFFLRRTTVPGWQNG